MRQLAKRIESAGKWTGVIGCSLVILSAVTMNGIVLMLAILFIGSASMSPAIADWLQTEAALEDAREREKAIRLQAEHAAELGRLRQPLGASDRQPPLIEWDSPSRSIH